ncbi:type II secretion system F family protein [Arthrobacter sp. H5]|uniref:type II secretion system F family protein n=1 Tax=Arthrobacter sp. H5 TaxID=1267973 RepID=UPI000488DAEB|nr:type II secretion system F family protein [Arthrobacter sp. H5]
MIGVAVSVLLLGCFTVLFSQPPARWTGLRGTVPADMASGAPPKAEDAGGVADAALMMDLMAAMLSAGSSVDHALEVLARSCSPPVARSLLTVKAAIDLGAPWDVAWEAAQLSGPGNSPVAELGRALKFAGTTGAPSAAIVHAYAAQFRRRRNRLAEQRAAALGVKLVVPLGLCALPAFVCLGVVPVLLGLIPTLQ